MQPIPGELMIKVTMSKTNGYVQLTACLTNEEGTPLAGFPPVDVPIGGTFVLRPVYLLPDLRLMGNITLLPLIDPDIVEQATGYENEVTPPADEQPAHDTDATGAPN